MLAPLPLRRSRTMCSSLACALLCAAAQDTFAFQDPAPEGAPPAAPEAQELPGKPGPLDADLGTVAAIRVPAGFHFLDAGEARAALEAMGNPSSQRELGMVMNSTSYWFVIFEYSDSGHVKDDDKDELDADALLASLRRGNDAANETRKERGWTTVELLGWAQPPHYDDATHNLEWATHAVSDGQKSVNYNTRILGRLGVMEVTLVCDAAELEIVLQDYKPLISGFDYKPGQHYAEVRAGDKIAEYGLTALVAGGAGVLAAKTGLFAKLWKLIAVGAVAVAAFFKRLFGKKSAAKSTS